MTGVNPIDYAADLTAAYLAGWADAEPHWRALERALVDQERRSVLAGGVVTRLATVPPPDPAQLAREREARAATRERLAQLKAPRPTRRTA